MMSRKHKNKKDSVSGILNRYKGITIEGYEEEIRRRSQEIALRKSLYGRDSMEDWVDSTIEAMEEWDAERGLKTVVDSEAGKITTIDVETGEKLELSLSKDAKERLREFHEEQSREYDIRESLSSETFVKEMTDDRLNRFCPYFVKYQRKIMRVMRGLNEPEDELDTIRNTLHEILTDVKNWDSHEYFHYDPTWKKEFIECQKEVEGKLPEKEEESWRLFKRVIGPLALACHLVDEYLKEPDREIEKTIPYDVCKTAAATFRNFDRQARV